MKSIATIVLWLCLVSSGLAKPPLFPIYHDSTGQYSFGYNDPVSTRSEYRASDGLTRGVYSFIDNKGQVQTTEYEAGKDVGFRVKATNLPLAPIPIQDTPEVKAARDKHLQWLDEAKRREESDRSLRNADGGLPTEEAESSTEKPMVKSVEVDESPKADPRVQMDKLDEMIRDEEKLTLKTKSTDDIKKDLFKNEEEKSEMMFQSFNFAPVVPILLTEPVKYTPEVAAAREAHFRAFKAAAKLAEESDNNPALLEKFLGDPNVSINLNESQMENKMFMHDEMKNDPGVEMEDQIIIMQGSSAEMTKISEELKPALLPIPEKLDTKQEAYQRTESAELKPQMNEEVTKIDDKHQNLQSLNLIKTAEKKDLVVGLPPASTSLRVMDTRLPTLNEFDQSKLKAGAYSVPIEISHLSPTNILPKLYPSVLGSSAFQYVYL